MYGIDRKRSFDESLRAVAGVGSKEITIVINTHLHFDHAGGNTRLDESGKARPAFPNARYLVSRAEYEHAEAPSERDRASYLPDNWRSLKESGQLKLKEPEYEVVPGLHMETHAGHNRSMQCVRLEQGSQTLFGFADLVPMMAHVPFAWIMDSTSIRLRRLRQRRNFCHRRRARIDVFVLSRSRSSFGADSSR